MEQDAFVADKMLTNNHRFIKDVFPNKPIWDQFWQVLIEKSGAAIASLKATIYKEQAKRIKEVKDRMVQPDFAYGPRYEGQASACGQSQSPLCRKMEARGAPSRTTFGGISGTSQGGTL